jgi:hypothetical protein
MLICSVLWQLSPLGSPNKKGEIQISASSDHVQSNPLFYEHTAETSHFQQVINSLLLLPADWCSRWE